jgi:signal transduction histidine kinase/ligand-binding sensor domain-containing protein
VRSIGVFSAMLVGCPAATPYLIDVWTPYEGLPQSQVLSIAQTPDGYLWISTQLGWIARFDGIRFTHFNPENTPVLDSPEIRKLWVDDRGVLWIADVNGQLISLTGDDFKERVVAKPGLAKQVVEWLGRKGEVPRFVTADGTLLSLGAKVIYEKNNNPAEAESGGIKQFCQDAEGVMWCHTLDGQLGRWQEGRFHRETDTGIPANTQVTSLRSSPAGDLWIGTDAGLWRRRAGVISRAVPGLSAADLQILQLAPTPDGSLWLRTPAGVVLTCGDAVVHSTALTGMDETPPLRPLEMHADSDGGVWVVKYGCGVWHVDAHGALTVLSSRNGLPSDLVETWFEDREKIIWLGTSAGLVRLRPRWFELIEASASRTGTGIVSITQDAGGAMWFGRADGLTRWQNGIGEDIAIPPLRSEFPIADVTVTPGESPGEVWLGTVQNGAMRLRDGQIEQPFPFALPGLAIRVVRKDPEGGVWFGGEFGLFRWDGTKLRKFGIQDGLKNGHIQDLSFDSQGNPWIVKGQELLVYRNGRFSPVPLPGVAITLRINTVLCGADGSVYIGIVGGGLLHLTRDQLFRYGPKDGLPGNSVTQLLEDSHGYLWGGTHQGIFRVSTTSLDMRSKGMNPPRMFQIFDQSDGLPAAECRGGFQPACWKARDGRLWFSTSACAVVIDPNEIRKNHAAPAVIIERMEWDGESVNPSSPNQKTPPPHILPGWHRYEFEFTAINFAAPRKIRFQWKLSGVDADWVEGRGERKATYNGLGPGDYRLAVRAANSDGVWSREPATFAFRVEPSFWQRSSVRVVFTLICLVLIYLLTAGIMRRKHLRELRELEHARSLEQQRFRHKQAMENERSRIAAELHDDLGANLTQIQWLGDAASHTHHPAAGDHEIVNRIVRKSRDMVRSIDEIVWAVNPKNDTLDQLVIYVCSFAEQYFRESPTRCRIDVAAGIPAYHLTAEVRHNLFLITKEALHNVAKHAAAERVWVRVACESEVFSLRIEDSGRGFELLTAEAGDGLANMRRRAQSAGADLTLESAPGQGTRVTLKLNLHPPAA